MFMLVAVLFGLGGLKAVLPAPQADNSVRFVQAQVAGKDQLVRVNTNAKTVHYHGNLRWDDVNRGTFAVYEKGGKLTTLAMYADRAWKFQEPVADELALWRRFFGS
ncbi:hypothetical protein HY971_01000 [Candidatus Kaiserbacteria bacterium]|nr:hypothetical protein [Candidatus Kaiserbacteria bacterium]